MCTGLHDFCYATLQVNINHLLRYMLRSSLTWWHNVDVNEIMPFTDENKQ